jgi:anti-anti-sigma factor
MAGVSISAATKDDVLVLRLRGDLDSATAAACARDLALCLDDELPPLLVFDMRDVEFCGSAGARLLLDTAHACATRGTRTHVVTDAHSTTRRVLGLAKAGELLQVFEDFDAALARLNEDVT